MKRTLFAFALVLWAGGAVAAPRVVIVDEETEPSDPGTVTIASDAYRLRLSGLFEATLGRDRTGNFLGLPRARLRAEGLLSTTLEVGFVAEVDFSPWSTVALKEDGPGFVRDLYLRMALGNKKVLDLGEARMGLFTPPVMAEQWRMQSEEMWLTGSLGREAWMPGRELAAAYEASGDAYRLPVRGTLTLGSGITPRPMPSLLTTPPPEQTNAGTAATNVPLTAGENSALVLNPSVSGRVEAEPLRRWTGRSRLVVGGGTLLRPLSTGADARVAATADVELAFPWVTVRGSLLGADTQRPPFFDSRSVMVEGALQVIPDFADVRARYQMAMGPTSVEAQHLSLGMALFYLDGAPPAPLADPTTSRRTVQLGRAFTLLWIRTYDLQRVPAEFTALRNVSSTGPLDPRPLGAVNWLVSGDTDQLVARISF
ncbi:MAG: hypothetical protein AB2A00_21500 [Myxococcota bacterium]